MVVIHLLFEGLFSCSQVRLRIRKDRAEPLQRRGGARAMSGVLSTSDVQRIFRHELVDEEAVKVINKQFAYLTRKGTFGPDEPRTLTAKLVYEEMKERVSVRKELSEWGMANDVSPDGAFKWATFDEWKTKSWKVRVHQKHAEKTGKVLRKAGVHKQGIKTAVGAARRPRAAPRRLHAHGGWRPVFFPELRWLHTLRLGGARTCNGNTVAVVVVVMNGLK